METLLIHQIILRHIYVLEFRKLSKQPELYLQLLLIYKDGKVYGQDKTRQAIVDPILMFFKVKANPLSTKNKFGPKRANNDFDFPLLYTIPSQHHFAPLPGLSRAISLTV